MRAIPPICFFGSIRVSKVEKKRNFTYRDVKNVYTIVFIEKSTKEFQEFPNTCIHRAKQQFDTGLL